MKELTEEELRLACEAVTRLPWKIALRRMNEKITELLAKQAKVGEVTAALNPRTGRWRFYQLDGPDLTLEEAREYLDASKYGGVIREQNERLFQEMKRRIVKEVPR